MKKFLFPVIICILALSACSSTPSNEHQKKPWWKIPPFSWFDAHGNGQEIFHWQRPHTGIQKFSTDHKYCMQQAATFKFFPAAQKWFHSFFYTEEKNLEIRADWNGKSGIWASFIPYAGAQPVIVNMARPEDDDDIDYQAYVDCMEGRGYTARNYNIPEVTNIYLRNPYQ
uniref:Lipoprotein n=1 Tax=uncultured Alphaproteobacteria bacterium TaxID=91750 RepID=A0A6G8F234_9PROT|nr:hypothetical protein PlAlph_0400 [uncultured Alphaproteobacteria bacterium]